MAIVNREAAEALIQTQLVNTIMQDTPKSSVFMQLARKLPNMTSKQTRIPVLDMLPMAYWVNGDTGFKQTSVQSWDNVYLNAGELAVIVPIPEAVLDDASFDILGEIKPRVVEAIGQKVDSAILFGTERPPEWGADIVTRARQAGNNVSGATINYDTFLGASGVISRVEQAGFLPNGGIGAMALRGALRGIKNDGGTPLYAPSMQGATTYTLDGMPLYFPLNGSFDSSVAQLIVGDWSQAVYSIRQDVTVKILDQGVIQNPTTKDIVYNLAQQDMIALRVVFRMGWALPNYATRMNGERLNCPFAYLEPATAATTYTATFTVKDNAEVPAAIEGAYVEVDGARLKTNASGQAVFNLRNGAYNYTVKKSGYTSASGSVTVNGSAATAAVTLAAN